MKTKSMYIVLIVLCIFRIDVWAQSENVSDKFHSDEKENVDSVKLETDSLQCIIEFQCGSITTLEDSIVALNHIIEGLEAKMGFVDTCLVKLANMWLYEKFDKEVVDEAITYMDRMYSSSFKNELSIVQELLRDYEQSYGEFQLILQRAQNDPDRANLFAVDEYKKKYLEEIQLMPYYRKYYHSDWNIRYLNEQISEALKRIKNHSAQKYADFGSLIDPRFLQ